MTARTAVITGGAGGLGIALEQCLRSRGWYTVIVDLPGSEKAIQIDKDQSMFIGQDLTKQNAIEKVGQKIRTARPSIDLVIYNAGITQIGEFSQTRIETHRKVFEINYFSAVKLVKELLADVRAAKGTHLAVSSVAGFVPLTHRAAYAASKHALEGFFKSLRVEEREYDVKCLVAAPSFVATNIGNPQNQDDGVARPGSAADGIDYMSPKDAAEIIIQGFEQKRSFIPVGRIARLSYILNRISPAMLEKLMERSFKKH